MDNIRQTIHIIRFSALGDLVTFEPILRGFRYFYPDSKIIFYTSNSGKDLYSDSGIFSEIIPIKKHWFFDRPTIVISTILHLFRQRGGVVINLQCNKPSHILAKLLFPKKQVNWTRTIKDSLLGRRPKPILKTELFTRMGLNPESVQSYWNKRINNEPELNIQEIHKKKWRTFLGKKPIIGFVPGASSRWQSKRWLSKSYIKLAHQLLGMDYQIVLLGGAENQKEAHLIELGQSEVKNLCGSTSITELVGLISICDLLIGSDTGLMHIAGALRVPTITLFGPTSPTHMSDVGYGGLHNQLQASPSVCTTCYNRKCDRYKKCMSTITVKEGLNSAIDVTSFTKK